MARVFAPICKTKRQCFLLCVKNGVYVRGCVRDRGRNFMILNVGDAAPDFEALLQDDTVVRLRDYRGQRLLLYFYPKDNTSGCTAEACSLRDGYEELRARGVEVLGVSPDTSKSHVGFIAKHSLPFQLVADTDNRVAEAYGAWGEKTRCGRTYMGMVRKSFLVGADGRIEHVFDRVNTKEHAAQVLEALGA